MKNFSKILGLLSIFGLFGLTIADDQEIYDVIISNGKVIDGSGNPWYYADVAVKGERIAHIGNLSSDKAHQIIDADGLSVAPGFIDPQTHAACRIATYLICSVAWVVLLTNSLPPAGQPGTSTTH